MGQRKIPLSNNNQQEHPEELTVFLILGFVLVIGAVIGGYLMEHGNLMVLVQPAELVIIGGAALGSLIAANPVHILKEIIAGTLGSLKSDPYNKDYYLKTLQMLYNLFMSGRKSGAAEFETEIENPSSSPSLAAFPAFLKNHHSVDYLCDTLRLQLMNTPAFELDALMEIDADTHAHEGGEPVSAIQSAADSLPGLGIVAAVLGVVITMGALGGPPEEIGHKVAAALVGTFLGILLCYGFLGPLAARIHKRSESDQQYLLCLRAAINAFARGSAPLVAAEFGRRAIPARVRPSFKDYEAACKGKSSGSGDIEAVAA